MKKINIGIIGPTGRMGSSIIAESKFFPNLRVNALCEKKNHPSIGKDSLFLKKGDEIGRFMLGSTVVVCFGKNKVNWSNKISANSTIKMGQCMGRF